MTAGSEGREISLGVRNILAEGSRLSKMVVFMSPRRPRIKKKKKKVVQTDERAGAGLHQKILALWCKSEGRVCPVI